MRKGTRFRDWLPGFLLVLPSIILVGIFVYWLIFRNVVTSLDRTVTRATKRVTNPGGIENYTNLLGGEDYQHALFNLLVLTVAFVAGTMFFGLLWAVLLEKGVSGEGVFRSVYLLPMAISFIAAGIVWRWLLSPSKGDQAVGLNQLLAMLGLERFQSCLVAVSQRVLHGRDGVARSLAAVRLCHGPVPRRFPGDLGGPA